MHNAKFSNNRMISLYRYLNGAGEIGATSLEICNDLKMLNPSTEISGLRHAMIAAGIPGSIETIYQGISDAGKKIYRYYLRGE